MARMIPPAVYSRRASRGEREVFHRLRDDPATEGWAVLHSLDVAEHRRNVCGELDFVVVIPNLGVACVEVKGCSSVRRESGRWYYGADPKPDMRGPFKQAAEAMHSLRRKVAEAVPSLACIPFWTTVIFPYVIFKSASPEWHDWQVIDAEAFRSQPISTLLTRVLQSARAYLEASPRAYWFDGTRREPNPAQCERLLGLLRPDFEFFETPQSRANRREEELKIYTQEQMVALDAMEANPRVVFVGPAGTGKTMLAIEAARRAVGCGQRVLFVCFNRLLGGWIEEQCRPLSPLVRAGTFHSFLLTVARLTSVPLDAGASFWSSELPSRAVDQMLSMDDGAPTFDLLVIDEGQDLLADAYLDVLDLCLTGGLSSGWWRVFGDFENQSLYGSPASLKTFLRPRGGQAPLYSLRVNCRSAPRIAAMAHLLGGLDPDYAKVLRADNGIEPELRYWRTREEQQTLLVRAFSELFQDGFRLQDIAVLSTRSDSDCAAARVAEQPWHERLQAWGSDLPGIRYCSIHAFKGLEAAAVIVTDVESVSGPQAEALFYVAVTRALDKLIILVHQTAKPEAIRRLLQQPKGSDKA